MSCVVVIQTIIVPDVQKLYALFESAAGYSLFKILEHEEVGELLPAVQESVVEYARFSKIVKLVSFLAFTSPEDALQNINDVSEGSRCTL